MRTYLSISEEDFKASSLLLKHCYTDVALLSSACYHAQQAIEKILKAYLERVGVLTEELKTTHSMKVLVTEFTTVSRYAQPWLTLNYWQVGSWATQFRYPTDKSYSVSADDVLDALRAYKEIREKVLVILK